MLAKRLRLRKRREFARVMREGRGFAGEFATVYLRPVPRREVRAGFSITRRFGTAVERNRAKRRLRHAFMEAVRVACPELHEAAVRGTAPGGEAGEGRGVGLRAVVVGKPGLKRASFEELKGMLVRILREGLRETKWEATMGARRPGE